VQTCDRAAFEAELLAATHGHLGPLHLASERSAWPLTHLQCQTWCGPGWVLVGDAAHVVHPLAGQGLNLGLADVQALSAALAAREPWRSVGDAKLLRRYQRERVAPTWLMGQVTNGLLDLFAQPNDWVRLARNRGLGVVHAAAPIKRWLTQRALGS
jgi:2-polyprenyl-6-methoxyphenol hydroxylase-like FAD-dependent oxidoreductase